MSDRDDPLDPTHSAHPLGERFERALSFAIDHHREHRRKGTQIPYAAHLLAVASIVLEMESGEDEAIAALLHDVIEDGGGAAAEAEIRAEFGDDVARIVRANSDAVAERGRAKPAWRPRKEAYVASIAAKAPDELRVSVADKLHNARSILSDHRRHGDRVFDRFTGGREGTLWYYRALIGAFEARRADLGPAGGQALDELRLIVAELARRAGAAEA